MRQSLSSKGTDPWSEISVGIPTGISVRVPMDMLVGISPEISTGIRRNSVKKLSLIVIGANRVENFRGFVDGNLKG